MMNAMMQETLLTGTANKADLPGWQAAGKTGTTQDFRDAWFVGYTSHLVAAVWLGNDDGAAMRKVTGGNLPVDVWSRFMRDAHQGVPAGGPAARRLARRGRAARRRRRPSTAGAPMAINKFGGRPRDPPRRGAAPAFRRRRSRPAADGAEPAREEHSGEAARRSFDVRRNRRAAVP